MQLYLYMALRSLLRAKLSLVLLIAAVTAGVAFQLPNAANLQGYTAELQRQGVSRATGHVLLLPRGTEPLVGVAATLKRVQAYSFVRAATARLVWAGVIFKGDRYVALRAVGVDPGREEQAAAFCQQVARGSCLEQREGQEVLVGTALAKRLELDVGQELKLTLPYEQGGEVRFAKARFKVRGVMRGTGGFTADHDLYLPIDELGYLVRVKDRATQLSLFVDDPLRAGAYARKVSGDFPGTEAKGWLEASDFVASAIEGNRTLFLISMTMVIFAVGIPVLALLMIHVLHERKQIAILAALGFRRRQIFLIYLLQAVGVGLLGAGLGIGLGLALCAFFQSHPIFSFRDFVIRPEIDALVVFGPTVALFCVTVLAGILPAIKASRADPCVEMREA